MRESYISISYEALRTAYETQRKLLFQGTIADLVKDGKGQDKITLGDWESEEAVINYLKAKNFQ